jgi:hypothetical protein
LRKNLTDDAFRDDLITRMPEGAATQDIKLRVREMEALFRRCLEGRAIGAA